MVERRWIGGSCPNTNCLPSKNEIRSAEIAHQARGAAAFGVATGPVAVDMRQVVERKRDHVAHQTFATSTPRSITPWPP